MAVIKRIAESTSNHGTVELRRTPWGWTATFSGERGEQVFAAFGSYTIPTAFTEIASSDVVYRAIERLNPDLRVIVHV